MTTETTGKNADFQTSITFSDVLHAIQEMMPELPRRIWAIFAISIILVLLPSLDLKTINGYPNLSALVAQAQSLPPEDGQPIQPDFQLRIEMTIQMIESNVEKCLEDNPNTLQGTSNQVARQTFLGQKAAAIEVLTAIGAEGYADFVHPQNLSEVLQTLERLSTVQRLTLNEVRFLAKLDDAEYSAVYIRAFRELQLTNVLTNELRIYKNVENIGDAPEFSRAPETIQMSGLTITAVWKHEYQSATYSTNITVASDDALTRVQVDGEWDTDSGRIIDLVLGLGGSSMASLQPTEDN